MGENANLIWLLLGAISILLQSHLSFKQGVQRLNQHFLEKLDAKARTLDPYISDERETNTKKIKQFYRPSIFEC